MNLRRATPTIVFPLLLLGARPEAPIAVPTLEEVGFLAGCWEGSFRARDGRPGIIEERYTPPSENLVLGTTRYLVDGRAVQFELTTIRRVDGEVLLLPYPGGTPSEHAFRLTDSGPGRALFEAPEHDFPKRIRYERGGTTLRARVDGGEGSPSVQEWEMRAAPCTPEGRP
ncbi:MAG TPA: DUF6265 family protein [Longimicrobiales bacterium]|nr:DUF6265 family protein [Longimicrobiales bacterium]